MGSVIRFVFRTNYRYGKFEQFQIILCLFGIALWVYILLNSLNNL